ncbi:MAG: hypothetical protein IT350_15265 [Deltaproteobacteria bacterium]|nr:hypothetical protein [Deltaproteobacteria bacterium]
MVLRSPANDETTVPPTAPILLQATGIPAATVAFILIGYVLPGWYVARFWIPAYEPLGFEASYQIYMLAFFAFLVVVAKALDFVDNRSGEHDRNRWLQHIAHAECSVGLAHANIALTAFALLGLIYILISKIWALVPLFVAILAAQISLFVVGRKNSWPIPRNPYTMPDKIPELEPNTEAREKCVRLAWTFETEDGRTIQGEIPKLPILEADWFFAAAINPTILGTGTLPIERLVDDMANRLTGREVVRIADHLIGMAEAERLTIYDQLCNALALAQSIPYQTDAQSKGKEEYWRYPVETLWDGCGDCEDKALLLCAIYRAVFRATPDPAMKLTAYLLLSNVEGHAAVAVGGPNLKLAGGNYFVIDGFRYYFCETTSDGRVGEIPPGTDPETYRPIPIT